MKIRFGIWMFTVIVILSPGLTFAGTIQLPKTGQTKCYDSSGTEMACVGTGQDGDIQAGVAWPNPRFVVGGDCVTDKLTGLMWAKNGNITNSKKTWQEALAYIASLNSGSGICGHKDWRLPNINELESVVNAQEADQSIWLNTQGFSKMQSAFYWSSTSYSGSSDRAWWLSLSTGVIGYGLIDKTDGSYVWPVRSSGLLGNSLIWKTGQTTSYAPGDDGDLQKGVSWPDLRFTKNDDCVIDNLTGLMWPQNANLPSAKNTWEDALSYVNNLSLCGYTDWRLPSRKELFSLIDHSQHSPDLPDGHPFINVQSSYYWTSTTFPGSTSYPWCVGMGAGGMSSDINNCNASDYIWPVRGGALGASGNQSCSFTITPTQKAFSYRGVSGSVSIVASDKGCSWTAISNDSWITIKSGGSGKTGKATYSVAANTSSSQRIGTMTIAGQTFTVTQAGVPCAYKISPTQSTPPVIAAGGSASFNVTATPSDCSWTSTVDVSKYPWITIDSGSSGTGNGTVGYTVAAKTTKPARTGKINIVSKDGKVKKTFTVKQAK